MGLGTGGGWGWLGSNGGRWQEAQGGWALQGSWGAPAAGEETAMGCASGTPTLRSWEQACQPGNGLSETLRCGRVQCYGNRGTSEPRVHPEKAAVGASGGRGRPGATCPPRRASSSTFSRVISATCLGGEARLSGCSRISEETGRAHTFPDLAEKKEDGC